MKAWIVRENGEFCETIVFAETRGKARAIAQSTECCEDVPFCDIEVKRIPSIDKYYTDGKKEMDWSKAQDRIAMVKDAAFECYPEYWKDENCEYCPAAEWCEKAKGAQE